MDLISESLLTLERPFPIYRFHQVMAGKGTDVEDPEEMRRPVGRSSKKWVHRTDTLGGVQLLTVVFKDITNVLQM